MKSDRIERLAMWALGLFMFIGSIAALAARLWNAFSYTIAHPALVEHNLQSAEHALFYAAYCVAWLTAGIFAQGLTPFPKKVKRAPMIWPPSENFGEVLVKARLDTAVAMSDMISDFGRILFPIFLILGGPYTLLIVLLLTIPGSLIEGGSLEFQLFPNARKFYLWKSRPHDENASSS